MQIKYLTLFLLLSTTVCLKAQETVTLSHYLFPDFQPGVVLLKNGVRNNAKLNYNAASEEMVFDENGKTLAIGDAVLPQIDTVFVADEKFIRINNKFVRILIDKPEIDLFVEHKCRLIPPGKPAAYGGTSQTSSTTSYSSILSDGRVYDLKLPDDYKIIPYNVFWLNRNGKLQSFSNLGQLKKIYRDKKKLVGDYLKKNEVKLANEKSVEEAITYLENN
ncbi:MAG: hypothetical protein PHT14_06670 [Petrimonas sp.]|jgi:hypothetical protein|uniref:hypothetical protein n=1 Tax=Petrimonas TaxID=307628 RepID=UPI000E8AA26E|nr:hypothetical protein [Petrimonas sp.]NLU28598.1 hypothetical protein [Bacteroidales bacterium]BBD45241.1 Hypothetical protein PEIBARAKI_5234 [Petrimonas sp. IBARAKI]HAC73836.1 hypothetical protein [Porphyromonadaceae bacterium]MDD3542653.1 hypothetical protein [Petrimonas sp.]